MVFDEEKAPEETENLSRREKSGFESTWSRVQVTSQTRQLLSPYGVDFTGPWVLDDTIISVTCSNPDITKLAATLIGVLTRNWGQNLATA